MGLRLLQLDLKNFQKLFEEDWRPHFEGKINDMIVSGFLHNEDSQLKYTWDGFTWANNVRTYFEGKRGHAVGYTDTLGIGESGKDHYSKLSRVKATDAEIA